MTQQPPILYSFRRCPYAIRARMAIIAAQLHVDLIEIDLKKKSADFLALSAKATVPVLKVNESELIEESLEIMQWALKKKNPLGINAACFDHDLIIQNDTQFKPNLDHYKYAVRFPEKTEQQHQQNACAFPQALNERLQTHSFLIGNELSVVDLAILPFIRQFSFVNKAWFDQQNWPHLQQWLSDCLALDLFKKAFEWGR